MTSAGIALLALVMVDAGVFRSGLYDYCVEVESSVGSAVQAVYSVRSDATELVAVVGDSKTTEGFSESVLDDFMNGQDIGLRGLNYGIPGASPRVWALLLECVDPSCDRFRFVVVPLGEFTGSDHEFRDSASRLQDLSFLGPILSLSQASGLANSYPDFAGRQAAWLGSTFKIFAYRYDIRAALADPMSRTVGRWRLMHGHEASLSYKGRPENMISVRIEGNRIIGYPSVIPDNRRRALRQFVFSGTDPVREQARSRYRTKWIGRICERYAGTGTQVVIVRLPPAVFPRQDGDSARLGPVLDHFAKLPHVHVVPVARTADLQVPKYYCDTTHLNRAGRTLWTQRLAEFIADLPK